MPPRWGGGGRCSVVCTAACPSTMTLDEAAGQLPAFSIADYYYYCDAHPQCTGLGVVVLNAAAHVLASFIQHRPCHVCCSLVGCALLVGVCCRSGIVHSSAMPLMKLCYLRWLHGARRCTWVTPSTAQTPTQHSLQCLSCLPVMSKKYL
jgi:hypothetical protein